MKVFFSWSGERSGALADFFKTWLPCVLQAVEPVFSRDTDKGLRWSEELALQLREASLGLIFLTPENLATPWILFEAGALSKQLSEAKTYTILFDLAPKEVSYPLAQFQHTELIKEDIRRFILSLRKHLGSPADEATVIETYEYFWPKLESAIAECRSMRHNDPPPKTRSSDELLEELIGLTRDMRSRVLSLEVLLQDSPIGSDSLYRELLVKKDQDLERRLDDLFNRLD